MVGAHKLFSTLLYFNKNKLKSKICNSTHASTTDYWLSEKWSSSEWVWTVPEQSPDLQRTSSGLQSRTVAQIGKLLRTNPAFQYNKKPECTAQLSYKKRRMVQLQFFFFFLIEKDEKNGRSISFNNSESRFLSRQYLQCSQTITMLSKVSGKRML